MKQKLKKIVLSIAFSFALVAEGVACPVCFGAKGDPVVDAIGWAILGLGTIISCVVGGIFSFFFVLSRRAAKYKQQLQEGHAEWNEVPVK